MEAFRQEVREWLETNCPESIRTPPASEDEPVWGGRKATFPNEDAKVWLDAMGNKGWTCPTWPKEYGGGGLSFEENKILQSELARINARPALVSFGISMLGPVLLEYGTEEQKQEHIPKIVRGEIRWCQGYSEPGSGSDLASLQTRAVVDGDNYIVNGSKIWTSYANHADWIFCLVRTDNQSPKHEGISFLLFDMTSEGVTTKPIQLISGASPFCETFFDDIRVPRANLMGKENQGWTIAKQLLQHERNMVAGMGMRGRARNPANRMENQAKRYLGENNGKIADGCVRNAITQHKMDGEAFALTLRRAAEESKTTSAPSPASSMFKYYGTEQNKTRFEIILSLMGSQSLGWEGDEFSDSELESVRGWLFGKATTIYGGSTEIQNNIIAKRVLGMLDHQ